MTVRYDVVVPTIGRPSLAVLLRALAAGEGPLPGRVILVADGLDHPLTPRDLGELGKSVTVVRGTGRGPAAARNAGWRASAADWTVFLDDDVVPNAHWRAQLVDDLAGLPPDVAGSQGRIRVPLPPGRRPTDWERNVKGLETAAWATADMAYRRSALSALGGFDERFPRPYREDADLALRALRAGFRLARGERIASHPVGPAGRWASIRLQAGNADDVLMWSLHGRRWRREAGAPRGRAATHTAAAAAALAAAGLLAAGRPRLAAAAAAGWLAATGELAWARIAPGPRTRREVITMLATSVVLPFAASFHRLRGLARLPRLLADSRGAPAAVLFDRDGTLVVDAPYNGDPLRVTPMPGAREALERLRAAGVRTAVVSNQSGVGRGLLTMQAVDAVNRRIEELLGPLGPWLVCPHHPDDGCTCRKPAPGLILRAAEALGVEPERCAVVGDIGTDVQAASAAGARSILVPTPRTRPEEIAAAAEVAPDLPAAVELLLGSR
jgi:histidinol-phosphate phosphatase family protein